MLFSPLCDEFTVEDPKDSQRMDAIGQIGVPFKVLAHIPNSYGLKDNLHIQTTNKHPCLESDLLESVFTYTRVMLQQF